MDQKQLTIKQVDEDQHLVYAEVYAPQKLDTDKEFMSAEDILEAAHKFISAGKVKKIDVQHDEQESGAYVVESFVAWEGQDRYIPGSWVLGVKIPDDGLWQAIKSGDINGFSFQAMVIPEEEEVVLDIPNPMNGMTSKMEDHDHKYEVWFDEETGKFLGGETDVVNGHYHIIKGSTITEDMTIMGDSGDPWGAYDIPHWHTFESIFDVHEVEAGDEG